MNNSFDFEQFKGNAIEQLKAGVPLSGKDEVLAPLLENLLNSVQIRQRIFVPSLLFKAALIQPPKDECGISQTEFQWHTGKHDMD